MSKFITLNRKNQFVSLCWQLYDFEIYLLTLFFNIVAQKT